MGLNVNSDVRGTFLSIVEGKLVKRVPEGTEHSIVREIEYEGVKKNVSELRYSTLDAMISSIEVKEGEKFGDVLLIKMQDGDEHFNISLNMIGREAKAFMCCLPNVNLSEPVKLNPYNYVKRGETKKTIGMGIQQKHGLEWKNVPYFYTTENGMPQVPDGADKDDFKLVMQQQMVFLKKKTKAFLLTAKFAVAAPVIKQQNEIPSSGNNDEDPNNDLPFRVSPNLFKQDRFTGCKI